MFTGLVEEVGCLTKIEKRGDGIRFQIEASKILEDIKIGDSINVSGCCLTVVEYFKQSFSCDLVAETLQRTYFHHLSIGDFVNLERAIKYSDRLGGHLVQGHIDDIGRIISYSTLEGGAYWVTIKISPPLLRYVVHKGSITIDGVSLTIAEIGASHFSFAMIPHTGQCTILGRKGKGDLVNVEVDLMAKYIEKLMTPYHNQG
ncbi:riboflavin synthase [Candidatus Protochlamydia amoebophila]|uniref:Riboflavin synthase n=1 Tax=Protochlamydia amoebophila (strain UWE25) TaxID=264201 RepID=Q6MCT4_PARUW|nr:riboflavin synthase [Candidatus Protochlamydia amoebophila]CAF23615.1 unnamed protein product [Candidatus Protochlamydia amoebophila UWE25]